MGIAMGVRGTEVAKEAADIVLLDDDLQSVAKGMEQGRLCAENLRKSVLYTMCSKVPQALPTFAQLLGIPVALTTVQVSLGTLRDASDIGDLDRHRHGHLDGCGLCRAAAGEELDDEEAAASQEGLHR